MIGNKCSECGIKDNGTGDTTEIREVAGKMLCAECAHNPKNIEDTAWYFMRQNERFPELSEEEQKKVIRGYIVGHSFPDMPPELIYLLGLDKQVKLRADLN